MTSYYCSLSKETSYLNEQYILVITFVNTKLDDWYFCFIKLVHAQLDDW